MIQEDQVEQEVQPIQETSVPMPEGPVDSNTPTENQQQETPQAINMRNLREAKERAERDRDELLKRVSALEKATTKNEPAPSAPAEDFSIAPDDLVEGKHLSKYDRKIKDLEGQLASYQQQSTAATVEAKLHAQYPDFEKVVTKENVEMLSAAHPEIAQTISSSGDLYSKAVSAYTLIKKFGITPQNTYDAERARAHENASKPRPLASVASQQGEDGPLSKANAFSDGLTEDLKKQLHKEMIESMR